MQFRAQCTLVEQSDLHDVVEHYFATLFPDPALHEWWYRPATAFAGDGIWRFYRLRMTELYVIDLEMFVETKIDARIRVDIDAVFQLLQNDQ